ncbi:hypothetical protein AB8Z62_07315 [Klebsiella pneumoniae subsp. pneumoniae]|uniref:hypothetical protein n=2 Tax=Klebsiella pneumoniae TaxID=573 RepID=UPI00339B3B00
MKERGMIFNGEMVRAILDGRKTQTRRPIKWKQTRFTEIGEREDGSKWPWSEDAEHACDFWHPCPFGAVGDRIWVRETFAALEPGSYEQAKPQEGHCQDLRYAATDRLAKSDADIRGYKWVPSIHMPRWASRILLEITDVRVERLNAISEEDATAEGVPPAGSLLPDYPGTFLTPKGDFATAKVAFQRLWESIYGEESWNANPWVWVISFERIEGGAA